MSIRDPVPHKLTNWGLVRWSHQKLSNLPGLDVLTRNFACICWMRKVADAGGLPKHIISRGNQRGTASSNKQCLIAWSSYHRYKSKATAATRLRQRPSAVRLNELSPCSLMQEADPGASWKSYVGGELALFKAEKRGETASMGIPCLQLLSFLPSSSQSQYSLPLL